MNGPLAFIPNDGYTESAILFERPGLYPRVEFTFRPMTIQEVSDYDTAAAKLKGMQLRRLAARCIRAHVKTWDVKAADDTIVPIEDGTILRLKDVLFNRLFGVITTQEAPDAVSDHSHEEEQDALLDDALQAIDTGRGLHELREERQRKN